MDEYDVSKATVAQLHYAKKRVILILRLFLVGAGMEDVMKIFISKLVGKLKTEGQLKSRLIHLNANTQLALRLKRHLLNL